MATRKSKLVPRLIEKRTPHAVLTLTIPVLKPRNPLATNPLLKKSTMHTDTGGRNKRGRGGAVEVQQGVQDALNRRRGGDDTASNGGDDSS